MTFTQNVRGYLTNPKLMFFSIWLRFRAIFLSYFCFLVCVFAVSTPWILFCDVGRRLLPSASDIREKALTRFSRLATNIVLTRTLSLIFVDLFVLFLIINTIIGQFFTCSFGSFFCDSFHVGIDKTPRGYFHLMCFVIDEQIWEKLKSNMTRKL